ATCASGLLVVGLEARGRGEVRDEADVGVVDAHAERVGGDEDARAALVEAAFGSVPSERRPARVVVPRRESSALQRRGDGLRLLPGGAVDDGAAIAEGTAKARGLARLDQRLGARGVRAQGADGEGEVRTAKVTEDANGRAELESPDDLLEHARRRG